MKLHLRNALFIGRKWETVRRAQCGSDVDAEWKLASNVFHIIGRHAVRPRSVLCRKCITIHNSRQCSDRIKICP